MHRLLRTAKRTSHGQLTLIDAFDREDKCYALLVEDLLNLIKLFKFYRTRTSYSEVENKRSFEQLWDGALATLAEIGSKICQKDRKFKSCDLDWWSLQTKDGTYLSMNWTPSVEDVNRYLHNSRKDLMKLVKRHENRLDTRASQYLIDLSLYLQLHVI
jgi:hypothetical protein